MHKTWVYDGDRLTHTTVACRKTGSVHIRWVSSQGGSEIHTHKKKERVVRETGSPRGVGGS